MYVLWRQFFLSIVDFYVYLFICWFLVSYFQRNRLLKDRIFQNPDIINYFFSLCDIYSIPYLLILYLYDGFLGGQGWAAEVVVGMLSFSRVLVVFVGAADFSLGCSLRGSWLPGETTSISNNKVLWHQLCISSICRFILTLCPKV